MNLAFPVSGRRYRLLAGWAGLLIYLVAFSPVGVGLAQLAGRLDPNHAAVIHLSANGTQVVLHHHRPGASHHHGLLAQTLTFFASSTRSAEPDHVLQFSSAEITSGKSSRIAPPATPSVEAQAYTSTGSYLPAPTAAFICRAARLPAEFSASLLGLRSTLLLI